MFQHKCVNYIYSIETLDQNGDFTLFSSQFTFLFFISLASAHILVAVPSILLWSSVAILIETFQDNYQRLRKDLNFILQFISKHRFMLKQFFYSSVLFISKFLHLTLSLLGYLKTRICWGGVNLNPLPPSKSHI